MFGKKTKHVCSIYIFWLIDTHKYVSNSILVKTQLLTVCVPHFLFTRPHVGEVVDDRLGQILQLLQLHLQRLQLLGLSNL